MTFHSFWSSRVTAAVDFWGVSIERVATNTRIGPRVRRFLKVIVTSFLKLKVQSAKGIYQGLSQIECHVCIKR